MMINNGGRWLAEKWLIDAEVNGWLKVDWWFMANEEVNKEEAAMGGLMVNNGYIIYLMASKW